MRTPLGIAHTPPSSPRWRAAHHSCSRSLSAMPRARRAGSVRRAPDAHVKALFDSYASDFDAHLVGPGVVLEAVRQSQGP